MQFKKAAVIGSGTMGPGIALGFALGGVAVNLVDISAAALQRGMDRCGRALDLFIEKGVTGPEEREAVLRRIAAFDHCEPGLAGVDLVIEAVSEDLEVKEKVYRQLDQLLPPEVVIGSNTSSYPVPEIFPDIRPGRLIIIHYFNPPQIMPLVEIVKTDQTPPPVIESLRSFYTAIGKYVIVLNKFKPGFLVNRVQVAVMREILSLYEEGVASAEEMDTAFKCCSALRGVISGPFEHMDMIGMDVLNMATAFLFPTLSNAAEVPQCISRMVGEGKLGFKSGEGFYRYNPDDAEEVLLKRDRALLDQVTLFKEFVGRGDVTIF